MLIADQYEICMYPCVLMLKHALNPQSVHQQDLKPEGQISFDEPHSGHCMDGRTLIP